MSDTITEAILGAWDEDEPKASDEESPEVAEPVETTPDEDEDQDDVVLGDEVDEDEKTPDEEGEVVVVEEPGEEAVEDEEPEDEEEPSGEEGQPESEDPVVAAFLARHGGDVDSALKAAANQHQLFGRQAYELGQHRQRIAELEAAAEQAAAFRQPGVFVTAEQQQWLEEAVSSENPIAYIQGAVEEQEFDLARAVLEQGEFSSYQAVRLAQVIDAAEGRTVQAAEPNLEGPLDHQALFSVLQQWYPDLPKFSAEMTSTIAALGDEHPLVALARSQDPEEAAQGIIGVYEIARAKSTTVASSREAVKQKSRQAAEDVRRKAQVSSAGATNPPTQTTRSRQVMPGLTMESLEAEFDAE